MSSIKSRRLALPVKDIEYSRILVREIDGAVISGLKDSIAQYGVIQPISVFLNEKEKWEVICGNHRLCAARGIGLKNIPVVVRECSSSEALMLSLVENIQRFEMDPLREGELYSTIGESSEVISRKINKSKKYVEDRILIFKSLDSRLKSELGKSLHIGNAVALAKLPSEQQLIVFSKMKAVSEAHFSQKSSYGGYGGRGDTFVFGVPSYYCICEKCGSKHLKGVSVGDDRRAEKILSSLRK